MTATNIQDEQPLNDLEAAHDDRAEAPDPQPESDSNPIPTNTTFQAGQGTALQRLFLNSNPTGRIEVEKVIVLSFRSLQLQRITELQDELLKLTLGAAAGKATPDHTEKVDEALENYAKALRNYETLSLNALPEVPRGATLVGSILSTTLAEPSRTETGRLLIRLGKRVRREAYIESFLQWLAKSQAISDVMTAIFPDCSGLGWAGVKLLLRSATVGTGMTPVDLIEIIQGVVGNLGFRELDPLGREKRSKRTALTERIFMAMFGGVALIAPMLIMTLHPSRNVSLITTSLATFIFALILALGATNSAGKDVLAATAAYAAVLVVFVGSNTTGSSQ